MKVYIIGDKIIDPRENKILKSGYFIFKEAVRYCNRQGWKWYYVQGKSLLHGRELWTKLGHILSPRMPEAYLFNRELHAQIYDILVKESSSYVPRPYIITKKIMLSLYKRGDGEFFGIWFVYHQSGVYFSTGEDKATLIWKPELYLEKPVEQVNLAPGIL